MSGTVEELLVRIDATTENLRRELKRADDQVAKATGSIDRRLSSLDKSFGSIGKSLGAVNRLLGPFALGLSAAGILQFARHSIQSADALAKTADKLGLNINLLQELRFAAQRTGVEQGTLDMAMQRFTRRVAEAAQGSGELKDTLIAYGIAVRDANGQARSTEAVLNDLANAIKNASSDGERLRIAFKAFDSEGAALVNTLKNGSAGLNELREEARRLGVVLDQDLARQAEVMNDALTDIYSTISTKLTGAFISLSGAVLQFLGVISKFDLIVDKQEKLDALNKRIEQLQETLSNSIIQGTARWRLTKEIEQLQKSAASLAEEIKELNKPLGDNKTLVKDGKEQVDAHVKAWKEWQKKIKETTQDLEDEIKYNEYLNIALKQGKKAVEDVKDSYEVLKTARQLNIKVGTEEFNQLTKLIVKKNELARANDEVTKAQEAAKKAQEDLLKKQQETIEKIADRTEEWLGDRLYGMLKQEHFDFLEFFKDTFYRTIADVAAYAIRNAIVVPIVQQVVGGGIGSIFGGGSSGGAGGGLFGGGGFNPLSSLSNVASLFTGGPSSIATGFAFSGLGSSLGLSTTAATAGVIEGGIGGAFFSTAGGGSVLTGAGSALVAAAPYLAAAAIALPVLLSMFGRKPSVGPTGVARLPNVTGDSAIQLSTDNGGNTDAVEEVAKTIRNVSEKAGEALGGYGTRAFGLDIGHFPQPESGNSQPAGFNLKRIIDNVLEDTDFKKGLTADEAITEGVRETLIRAFEGFETEEVSTALKNSVAKTIEELLSDLDFANMLGKFADTGELEKPLTAIQQQFQQLEDDFEAAKDRAEELGLSLDLVTDYFDALNDQLSETVQKNFDAAIRDATGRGYVNSAIGLLDARGQNAIDAQAAGLDVNATAGELFAAQFRQLLDNLSPKELVDLLSVSEIASDELASSLVHQAIATRQVDAAAAALTETLNDQADVARDLANKAGSNVRSLNTLISARWTDSNLSPLSIEDRLAEANRQFYEAVAVANDNNPMDEDSQYAISQLPTLQQTLLQASKDYYGSSVEYYDDFIAAQKALTSVSNLQRDIEKEQLEVLERIEQQLAANGNNNGAFERIFGSSYYGYTDSTGKTQYISDTGYDLGYKPDRAFQILRALFSVGASTPSGFGEGQLNSLRSSNSLVDAIVSGLGFADGASFSNTIVKKPGMFSLADIGEEGAEAIMPLSQSADGSLGVRASGGMTSRQAAQLISLMSSVNSRLEAIQGNTGSTARTVRREASRPKKVA